MPNRFSASRLTTGGSHCTAQWPAVRALAWITNSRPKAARYGQPMRVASVSGVAGLAACSRLPSIASEMMQPGCRNTSASNASSPITGPASTAAKPTAMPSRIISISSRQTVPSPVVRPYSGASR